MTDDDEYYVVFGTVVTKGMSTIIDCDRGGSLPLGRSALSKVRPVTSEGRELFGDADFWVPLLVRTVSDEHAETEGLVPSGINLREIAAEA